MARVIVALSLSLDGFIAGPNGTAEQPLGQGGMRLFDWYFDGDTPIRAYDAAANRAAPVPPFTLSRSSAAVFGELVERGGAVVTGRRTYDITNGWGGNGPPPGLPLFILTHRVPTDVPRGESAYIFVTNGIGSAISQAKAAAGDRYVSVMGAAVPQQRLFDHLGTDSIQLEPIQVVDSPGVTHLRYRVLK